jgi:hypothetical protein
VNFCAVARKIRRLKIYDINWCVQPVAKQFKRKMNGFIYYPKSQLRYGQQNLGKVDRISLRVLLHSSAGSSGNPSSAGLKLLILNVVKCISHGN